MLPESFKLYPIYTLSLLKAKVFRAGAYINSDQRVFYMRTLYSMGVAETIPFFYPRMFAIHNLEYPVIYVC